MPLDWEQVIVDSSDPEGLGRWWASALGWVTVNDPEEFEIRPAPDQIPGLTYQDDDEAAVLPADATPEQAPWDQRPPELVFVPVPQGSSSQVSAEAQGSHG